MRVHITTEEYVVIDDVVIDDIVWNKNPESRFQTKIGRVCFIKNYFAKNYLLCKLCNMQQIIILST